MPQKKYDLRNQFEQAARRYSNDEERSTRIQAVIDAHHKQAEMPRNISFQRLIAPLAMRRILCSQEMRLQKTKRF